MLERVGDRDAVFGTRVLHAPLSTARFDGQTTCYHDPGVEKSGKMCADTGYRKKHRPSDSTESAFSRLPLTQESNPKLVGTSRPTVFVMLVLVLRIS